jgi:hypothetical protein
MDSIVKLIERDILKRASTYGPGNPPPAGMMAFAHLLYFNFAWIDIISESIIDDHIELFKSHREHFDKIVDGSIKTDFEVSKAGLKYLYIAFENEELKQTYAVKRISDSTIMNQLRPIVYARDGYKCLKCGSTKNLSLDHIIPMIKGGLTVIENLQTLCTKCNSSKHTKTISYLTI